MARMANKKVLLSSVRTDCSHSGRWILFLLLWAFGNIVQAQTWTNSERIKQMLLDAETRGLPIAGRDTFSLGMLCPDQRGWAVYRDSLLVDMGLCLFPKEMDRTPAPEIYTFAERYALALLLKGNHAGQVRLLETDEVKLRIGNRSFAETKLPFSLVATSWMINQMPVTLRTDSNYIEVAWGTGANRVALFFPKQYDLILGQDKMELTHSFFEMLDRFWQPPLLPPYPINEHADEAAIHFEDGGKYWIESVRAGNYKDQTGRYIFDERFPQESLANLFEQADQMGKSHWIRLTVKGYHYRQTRFFPLSRWCALMREKQCRAYTGIETEIKGVQYTGSVFYINRNLMYKHLFHFRFPARAFRQEDVLIEAEVYPYIPINNIETLYDQEE